MRARLDRFILTGLGVALGTLAFRGAVGLLSPAAHAEIAGAEKPLIAVCAVPTLINELMQSDRFRPALQETAPEIRSELESIAKEVAELRQTLQGGDPSSPDAQKGLQRFRELSARASQLQQQLSQAIDKKMAEQLIECYELVRASADAVADDLGFEYVIATGGVDEKLTSEQADVILRQITARPVVRYPKTADITDDVRDDLKLD